VVIERELEGIAHIVADGGGRTAETADEPDLDGLLLGERRRCPKRQQRDRSQENSFHVYCPPNTGKCAAILVDRFMGQKASWPWLFALRPINQSKPQPRPAIGIRAGGASSNGAVAASGSGVLPCPGHWQ
jgi:hypothetical protein